MGRRKKRAGFCYLEDDLGLGAPDKPNIAF
jgi:hypothetical protein